MKNIFTIVALLTFCFAISQDDRKAFQDLKQLEGKWVGTLNLSNGSSKSINLNYSIRSNGSALVEESNEGGVEMMTIINLQKDKILSTHYCGAMNRPVAELQSNENGVVKFLTNQTLSGLDEKKELFVGAWELNLLPDDSEKFIYKYTAVAPDGGFTAVAEMTRTR